MYGVPLGLNAIELLIPVESVSLSTVVQLQADEPDEPQPVPPEPTYLAIFNPDGLAPSLA